MGHAHTHTHAYTSTHTHTHTVHTYTYCTHTHRHTHTHTHTHTHIYTHTLNSIIVQCMVCMSVAVCDTTGIGFVSYLIHKYSLSMDTSNIPSAFNTHHTQSVGKPYVHHETNRWMKCAVNAKSKHNFALWTMNHNESELVRELSRNATSCIFPEVEVKLSTELSKMNLNDMCLLN